MIQSDIGDGQPLSSYARDPTTCPAFTFSQTCTQLLWSQNCEKRDDCGKQGPPPETGAAAVLMMSPSNGSEHVEKVRASPCWISRNHLRRYLKPGGALDRDKYGRRKKRLFFSVRLIISNSNECPDKAPV